MLIDDLNQVAEGFAEAPEVQIDFVLAIDWWVAPQFIQEGDELARILKANKGKSL